MITYTDKQTAVDPQNPVDPIEKWKAVDANEVKSEVNTDITNLSNHTSNTSNPHSVTATQVGLGNVDNTSDVNKPVSSATQNALNGKQDSDSDLTTIAGLTPSNDDFLQRKSGAWANRTVAQVQADLGIGAATWGTIIGTLSNQTDLQTALNLKANVAEVWTTFTPSTTGWTSTTENYGAYILKGKICHLHLRITNTATGGTGTTATITNLPALPKHSDPIPIVIINSGVGAIGRFDLTAGSATAAFYTTGNAGVWTNGTNRYVFVNISYEVQ